MPNPFNPFPKSVDSPRPGCLLWLLAAIIAVPLLVALTSGLWLPGLGHWLEAPSNPAPAQAIVVLGGGEDRIDIAVALYKQGFAPELWYTGNVTPTGQRFPIQTQLARQAAVELGVPADAIHLLPTTSTWEDGQQIAALAQQRNVHSIIAVTSWHHGRRGLCIVRRHLQGTAVQVTFQAASNSTFGPDNWWQNEEGLIAVVNEYIKFAYYWLHYGLAPWSC